MCSLNFEVEFAVHRLRPTHLELANEIHKNVGGAIKCGAHEDLLSV